MGQHVPHVDQSWISRTHEQGVCSPSSIFSIFRERWCDMEWSSDTTGQCGKATCWIYKITIREFSLIQWKHKQSVYVIISRELLAIKVHNACSIVWHKQVHGTHILGYLNNSKLGIQRILTSDTLTNDLILSQCKRQSGIS